MESSTKVHIVAVSYPAQSHTNAMMYLCKRLAAEQGFIISFVSFDSLHDQMVKYWESPPGLDIRLASIPFKWKVPKGFDAYCLEHIGEFFEDMEKALIPELEKLVRKLSVEIQPVSCIISDYFLSWTQDAADLLGIPRNILWSGSAAWASIEYHLPQLITGNHIFPTEGRKLVEDDEIIDTIGGLEPLREEDIPVLYKVDDKQWEIQSLKRATSVQYASWILVNSFYELEPETFDFMRKELSPKFIPIGPLFLVDKNSANVVLRNEDEQCMKWLDEQEVNSVLYISFGSIAVLFLDQFLELANALEATKQPFLWVIRPELVVKNGVELVQDNGHTESEESYRDFCERTKKQGLVVPWCPQVQVLEHKAVGGFLTHCGWNSCLESICNGVPTLGWPYGAEQNTNCKLMVHDWKVGAGFTKDSSGLIKSEEIKRVINQVMVDDDGRKMRENAANFARFGRRAVETYSGGSYNSLNEFIRHLRA